MPSSRETAPNGITAARVNMLETYRVRLTKDYLVFSAAHFITFNGDVCERLHGHNYRVMAEVFGPLDENHYVIDFIALRDILHAIVLELDHHVLLPTEHPLIRVAADQESVEAVFRERRWVFPLGDCVLLPVPNTTAEMLARHIGRRLLDDVAARNLPRPERVTVEVDECEGQSAVCDIKSD
ncbi:MAG TPA: 6-pyruvoyl tetrahydropterin synthase family protein [Pirellulales bacterium]|nr:6-pyruvoyl tetrahydropterin synthase family protein [Pirellulales bacterium]